jgi:hypothetical protein
MNMGSDDDAERITWPARDDEEIDTGSSPGAGSRVQERSEKK